MVLPSRALASDVVGVGVGIVDFNAVLIRSRGISNALSGSQHPPNIALQYKLSTAWMSSACTLRAPPHPGLPIGFRGGSHGSRGKYKPRRIFLTPTSAVFSIPSEKVLSCLRPQGNHSSSPNSHSEPALGYVYVNVHTSLMTLRYVIYKLKSYHAHDAESLLESRRLFRTGRRKTHPTPPDLSFVTIKLPPTTTTVRFLIDRPSITSPYFLVQGENRQDLDTPILSVGENNTRALARHHLPGHGDLDALPCPAPTPGNTSRGADAGCRDTGHGGGGGGGGELRAASCELRRDTSRAPIEVFCSTFPFVAVCPICGPLRIEIIELRFATAEGRLQVPQTEEIDLHQPPVFLSSYR
ncbi:hypothetical protein B2J93_3579 [Marssonina coronariae]|uniref:Uncharacterized protein n=1 Tax=Diplocarpon coronariae TaxID=2795749 RepID=A0A218Z2A1_9HELO|nr:hypothetical protein B2J93_3579 [Marssonina coronariae]